MHPRQLCCAWLLAVAAGCGASAATLRITSPPDVILLPSSPPYRVTLQIPANTRPRAYHLTAIGAITPGITPGKFDDSDNVTIHVEPAAPPSNCRVEPNSAIDAKPGEEHVLRVLGVYAGGSEIDLTESKWARYQSEAPQIASVSKYGVITAVAPGRTHIRACGMFMLRFLSVAPDRREHCRRSRV